MNAMGKMTFKPFSSSCRKLANLHPCAYVSCLPVDQIQWLTGAFRRCQRLSVEILYFTKLGLASSVVILPFISIMSLAWSNKTGVWDRIAWCNARFNNWWIKQVVSLFWVATASRYIRKGRTHADERLSKVLKTRTGDSAPEKELNAIYTMVLVNSIPGNPVTKRREYLMDCWVIY